MFSVETQTEQVLVILSSNSNQYNIESDIDQEYSYRQTMSKSQNRQLPRVISQAIESQKCRKLLC